MNKYIENVREFHEVFEHPVNSIGGEHLSIRQLRIKLLFEELKELAEASDCRRTLHDLCLEYAYDLQDEHGGIEYPREEYLREKDEITDERGIKDGNNVNHVEELDALCDLQYVLSGKVLTGGYHNVFDAAFEEVHKNNMSKACESEITAKATVEKYQSEGTECEAIERLGRYIIKRDDGKILKSIRYAPVSLDRFVNGYE